jgi:hypothetical protein
MHDSRESKGIKWDSGIELFVFNKSI